MNAADRIALVDRLARAIAWTALSDAEQTARRRDADALVAEVEIGREQLDRIGWLLVDMPPGDGEEVES